jgi:archaellum component FlaC
MQNINWELIGVAIGVVATVLGGVWFIFIKIFGMGRFAQRVEYLDKRTCHAACDSHDEDISVLKDDVRTIREDISSVKNVLTTHEKDIEIIKNDIGSVKSELNSVKNDITFVKNELTKVTSLLSIKYKDAAPLFALKNSPRKLNDFGELVLKDIKGIDFLQTNKDFFFAQINAVSPKTAYDVENVAHTVCLISIDNEIFNGIKNFIYNSPSYTIKDEEGKERKYDLSLPDVCFVLSLPLRDMYLAEHPEILSE